MKNLISPFLAFGVALLALYNHVGWQGLEPVAFYLPFFCVGILSLHAVFFFVLEKEFTSKNTPGLFRFIFVGQSILIVSLLTRVFFSPFLVGPLKSRVFFKTYVLSALLLLCFLHLKSFKYTRLSPLLRSKLTWFTALSVALFFAAKSTGFHGWFMPVVALFKLKEKISHPSHLSWITAARFPGVAFSQPVRVVEDPVNSEMVYVLERRGKIFRVDLSSGKKSIFLDFSERVAPLNGENGATAFVFHPNLRVNPYLYVFYTFGTNKSQTNRLSRFQLEKGGNVLSESETVLIDQTDRNTMHNGGGLAFGPDGYLYLGVGDEGGSNDKFSNAQTISRNLFSGILRIDVNRLGGKHSHPIRRQPINGRTQNYFIPNDNPFVDVDSALEEFWSIGLRNPYQISFDSETGELWVGDVGEGIYEEINLAHRGSNHGWSFLEGIRTNPDSPSHGQEPFPLLGVLTAPVYTYAHTLFRRAIIGGFVSQGHYYFADCTSGEIFSYNRADASNPVSLVAQKPFYPSMGISWLGKVKGEVLLTDLGLPDQENGRILTLRKASQMAVTRTSIGDTFNVLCARCHLSGARDFRDLTWQQSVSDKYIEGVIRDGGAAHGLSSQMPAWKNTLSQEDILRMVRFIREFPLPPRS